MAEFQTNACGTICLCLLNLLAIRCLQLWSQPMGPLCLWQCFFYRERFCRSACKDWLKTNVVIFLGWCDLRPDVSEKKISWITMRCRRICDKDIPFSTLTEHVFDFIFNFVCLWFIWLLSNSSIHLRAKWIKPLICRQMTFLSFSQDKKIEKVKEKNK